MSAFWLILLVTQRSLLDGGIAGTSLETDARNGVDPDRPTPRTRGPPDERGAPRPADGCSSDLVRTITAEIAVPFHRRPVGRAAPDRDP
jgi:hypothetical protein